MHVVVYDARASEKRHSLLMPPAVNRSYEWSSYSAVQDPQQIVQPALRNHVLLSSAAISTPPPHLQHTPIMPYEDGSEFTYFPRPYTPCSNILQDDSFDGFSYLLTSSRSVLDLDHDMSTQLWSTATHKKVNLEVPDCWAVKPVREWSEDDVAEWLTSLGVSQELITQKQFRVNGTDLVTMHSVDRNYIASIEAEFNVEIFKSLQAYMEQDQTPTTEHQPPLPGFHAMYEQDIKQEESSQSSYLQHWEQYQNKHETSYKEEDFSSESDTERESVRIARGARTGRRGRPPSIQSKAAKRKLEKRHGRLWEFIRDLLKNPEYCPSLICWENHDEGVFRFVSSEKVAQLWGSKRGNTKMTYEKLSRAMRYYYKSNILQPVTHRRLVYRFGPNATNWRHPNPNFRRPV